MHLLGLFYSFGRHIFPYKTRSQKEWGIDAWSICSVQNLLQELKRKWILLPPKSWKDTSNRSKAALCDLEGDCQTSLQTGLRRSRKLLYKVIAFGMTWDKWIVETWLLWVHWLLHSFSADNFGCVAHVTMWHTQR